MADNKVEYEEALKKIEENEEIVRDFERKQERIKRGNEIWWKEYKRKDFESICGPYYRLRKWREFTEIWVGATKTKSFEEIKCSECFTIFGKLVVCSEDLVRNVVQKEFSEVRRTFVECECGRCWAYIQVFALKEDDGKPGGMPWHLL